MTAAMGPGSGAAGTIANDFVLTNTGTEPCTLDGYPTLQLVANGQNLTTNQTNGVNRIASLSTTPALVTLAPGGQASIVLLYSDVPGGTAACPVASQLVIGLPGGGGTVTASFSFPQYSNSPCYGDLDVYPVMAGIAALS